MVSLLLTVAILAEVTYPTQVFALTGGPGQPEVQSFEPVGTSDMVDLSTGDFNYNIPLLDVEGYPINIAYHGGITMDQEASWVGLGWNINPGVVNRNMRGLPDDFSGDVVTKELNIKPNKTWGVGLMLNAEIYGFPIPVDITQGFNYNNYTGPSISQGISLSHGIWSKGASGASASLGLNSSSDDGLTIQPSVSFQRMANKETEKESKSSLSIGTSINSRAGMKQFTISASISNPATRKMGSYLSGRSGGSGSLQNGTVNVSGTFDLGMPTYTPNITMSMKNHGFSGNFSLGGELYGSTFKVGLSGFFSSQKLAKTTITNQAYGYMYSQNGESNDNALMDFNREKDGTFTENTAFLPITNFTYDTYSVCGQGVGGSYRPFRSDVGHVFDPAGYTTNDDAALTVEVGLGGWVHFGTNIGVTDVNGRSGKWKDNNNAESSLRYSQFGSNPDYESVYFKEANEKSIDSDTAFYSSAGADRLTMPPLDISGKYEHPLRSMGPIKRTKRDKRSQVFSYLKRLDYNAFAVQPVSNTYSARPSHIAEVTTLGTDGTRYVYGIAAYNTTQKEVTFSVGSTNPLSVSSNLNSNSYKEATEGLIGYYADVDNTKNNTRGVDNYFSATTTPAYAHSYLLTSVLSADYIDADNVRGPSDNDYGSYTRFVYKKPPGPNYKWRVPYEYEKATYTEGLKSDLQDDKANYIYGEKELWYLDSVVTKNYVAVFYKSNRQDGLGVKGENGGYDASDSKRMQRLDSIALFSKQDLRINGSSALPVKCVHFEYSYELCGNIPNVSVTRSASAGKLTLKKIYFSYQNSNKARLTPYIFDYHENNPAENPQYNIKAYDRWGNYKPNNASRLGVSGPSDIATYVGVAHPLPPAEFPYVEQDTTANTYAAVWSLKEIQLPSGGKIKITYEADDYAYVQNQPAMQMFRIANYGNDPSDATNYIDISSGNGKFYFKLQEGVSDIGKYIIGITDLYFRCLTKIRDVGGYNHLEYVSGYGTLGGFGTEGAYGWIRLRDINLRDDDLGTDVNPVVKTAIQFSRLYMPKKVWTKDITTSYSQATNTENSSGLSASILNALVNSDFTKNIKDAITGPDEILYITTALGGYEVGRSIVPQKSWIRLNNPNSHKYGGGARVKKIEMSDEWGKMTGNDPETANYGQEYTYTLPNGSSSGVASYEPLPGGDENPYRQPVYTTVKKRATPDERSYQELPIGECFYPSPNVCYSMVTVKNLQRDNVTRHATGKVVHEFYTAKDFPTITSRTNLVHKRGKDSPFSLFSMLKFNVRDYLTAAQGFMIEQNDMHGKPKSQKVYQEGLSTPISSIEYKYKMESYSGGANKLSNKCTVIEKNGNVSVKRIGEFFDMVADFREDKTTTNSAKIQLNLDVIPGGPIPISVPMPWPSISNEKTRFRSATTTKVIQRFGILEETVATDLGSVVATKNLAYDGETGEVLLTATTTNYNDVVYNLRYPAWWYYESMGPAYQNIGFEIGAVFNLSGVCSSGTSNLASYFREGDEVSLSSNIGNIMGWVTAVTSNSVTVVKKDGTPVSGAYRMKVLRSGQRNMTTVDMATLTTLTNPLGALKGNAYENVLQAAAVEFSNSRKTFCDCETTPGSAIPYTSNDYITGKKGSWRPLRSYTHLTGRSHSNYDNNTNIRKDGVFTSYTPFYKWVAGKWDLEPDNWTYVSEVTAFNTIGEELENKDALGRYSSATFGYNQSMALSVAANSMQKEQAFDGFEDYTFRPCADSHFRIDSVQPVTTDAHTGRYSLKVSGGAPKTFSRQLAETCEDVTRCRLIMTVTEVSSSVYNIGSSLGTAPYSYDWKIVSGSPSVSITTAGIRINGTGCEVKVSITDSKGCITTQTIKH
ncbi:MAG: hypothetical protein JWO09_2745 [Bacteroidetes bacterium]|nr:hypothetical protein [Bacteroidota bacterium]